MHNRLTREQLLLDLRQAYLDARRHKRNKPYQRLFEARLEENLGELCDELWNRSYRPQPSTCFLISDPKRREGFAAQFRDRIVHHLYFNYTHELLERTFIHDSYSCIKGRGTHFGIARLERHIRQVSQNWTEPCYVLKMDIRGYFMHINRQRLLEITLRQLRHMVKRHPTPDPSPQRGGEMGVWPCPSSNRAPQRDGEMGAWPCPSSIPRLFEGRGRGGVGTDCRLDMDLIEWLSREIILLDPTTDCYIHGNPQDWNTLPRDKSLFHSPEGCGLPIGNLTSQLFSNVYLNELDQYMKRTLRCRHYGRYVDDFYVVSADRQWLRSLIPKVRDFLLNELGLRLHEGKVCLYNVRQGGDFLGAYLKPRRRYVSNTTLRRMNSKVPTLADENNPERLRARINSMLGILSHYRSVKLQQKMFLPLSQTTGKHGSFVWHRHGLLFRLHRKEDSHLCNC